MKEWEVWIEGYAATGELATASLQGRAEADTFEEACIKVCGDKLDKDRDGKPKMSIWACRLFPSEGQARVSFG